MENINILDCTLRDGGYINDWNFKRQNIKKIINNLFKSRIEIVECGFLNNKREYSEDRSVFDTVDRIAEFLPEDRGETKYVCMINYGEYEAVDIPEYSGKSINGIRIAFHKEKVDEAIKLCHEISKKGYLVFVQPMVTNNYTDMELLNLIKKVNKTKIFAFYIADSFGVMKQNDLLRMFYIIDKNLREDIYVGYHAHNNLQMAYSNAQTFILAQSKRKRIVDSSVFGMGRGAGNLNSELFTQHLNDNFNKSYKVYPLLQIIDDILNRIYAKNYWGYSLPYFLSATFNCHPNYASYLSEKNTLTIKSISDILNMITNDEKSSFNKEYIEELYLNHQKQLINDKKSIFNLREKFKHRNVLIVAPGGSIEKFNKEINDVIKKENALVISINFISNKIFPDYIFISNEKRFEKLVENKKLTDLNIKLILTSNINTSSNLDIIVNYNDLLNNIYAVKDNSALMLLKLLSKLEVNKIFIAGLDGYVNNELDNYVSEDMVYNTSIKLIEEMNEGMKTAFEGLTQEMNILFVTPTRYVDETKH